MHYVQLDFKVDKFWQSMNLTFWRGSPNLPTLARPYKASHTEENCCDN